MLASLEQRQEQLGRPRHDRPVRPDDDWPLDELGIPQTTTPSSAMAPPYRAPLAGHVTVISGWPGDQRPADFPVMAEGVLDPAEEPAVLFADRPHFPGAGRHRAP